MITFCAVRRIMASFLAVIYIYVCLRRRVELINGLNIYSRLYYLNVTTLMELIEFTLVHKKTYIYILQQKMMRLLSIARDYGNEIYISDSCFFNLYFFLYFILFTD